MKVRRWWVTTAKQRLTWGIATLQDAARVQSITQVKPRPDNWPHSSTSQPVAANSFECVNSN